MRLTEIWKFMKVCTSHVMFFPFFLYISKLPRLSGPNIKIGLKRIRIKWCERFSDFNRMWGKNLQNFKRFITEKKPDYYFLWNCTNSRKKSAEVKPQKIGLKREKSFEDNRALLLIFHSLVFQLFFKEVAKKWCKGNVN